MKIIITESQFKYLLNEGLADDTEFQNMVKSWEGSVIDPKTKLHVTYDDVTMKPVSSAKQVRGTMTIGYGTTKSIYPNMKPGEKIPEDKAEKLLKKGIENVENDVIRLIPKYNNFPRYVKMALLNAKYRGDLGPKTIELINDNKWDKVYTEYLDHPNYTNPGNLKGVVTRMKSNADAFKKYANELKNKTTETPKKDITTKKETGDKDERIIDLSDPNWLKKYIYGIKYYATKTRDTDFVNIRYTPEVNNGLIDNKIGMVKYPNPVGIVKDVKTVGLDTWLYMKLDPSVDAEDDYGWVNYKYVSKVQQ